MHVGRQPGAHVDAVGDVADRHLLFGPARIEVVPHPARHAAVQGRHAVAAPGEVERQHRRAERRRRIVRELGAERHDPVEGHAEAGGERLQVPAGEVGLEAVVPGLDRRVGREHAGRRHLAQRVVRGEPLLLHDLARPLEQGEGGVPFVQMEHRGLDPQPAESAVAADAEQDLLLDARLLVAAVEARRQLLVRRARWRRHARRAAGAGCGRPPRPRGGPRRCGPAARPRSAPAARPRQARERPAAPPRRSARRCPAASRFRR